jgi:myo-inositol 2-dehydrogenase/D-chiro-inositol 1-dehydrogenase
MHVAVIGAGRMGAIRAEDLASDPRVTALTITNRTLKRAEDLATRVHANVAPWAEATAIDADGYVMAVATHAHTDILESILATGKPVLCEKPIALTLAETERMMDIATRHGTPLQVGFQRRFDPGMRAAYESVTSGAIGTVYDMVLASRDHTPPQAEFLDGSGGIFRDLHVHDFDIVQWITGSPIATIFATRAIRGEGAYAEFDDADVTRITLVTESDVQASIAGARHNALGHDVRIEVYGSKDSLSAGLTPRTPLHTLDDADSLNLNQDPYTGFIDRFRDAFRAETTAFVDLLAGGPNPCPPDAALESLRAAIACERSVASAMPIHLRDVQTDE